MDPFSALAVATAALQVIDFSAKLVTTGTELFKHGSTNRTIDLEWAATELRDYTERLQNALQLGPNTRSLAEAESVSIGFTWERGEKKIMYSRTAETLRSCR